ncbi:MAG: HRDC domain-containing protein, partial [Nitrospira sp.]|nr:HRDC domain-containing protein [Nitrospira sp.]
LPRLHEQLERLLVRDDAPCLMHSGQNDVLALRREHDYEFGMIRDTAVAATLLGFNQTGLATLADAYLDVKMEKDLQRHDWARRPIRDEHVHYLVNDTQHLFALQDRLELEIERFELTEEYEIECAEVALAQPKPRGFDSQRFRRIKSHIVLDDFRRGGLKALYTWRDALASELDRAPFRVVADATLLDLARTPPKSLEELESRRGLAEWIVKEHAEALLRALHEGMEVPEPSRPRNWKTNGEGVRRMTPKQRQALSKLKRWREQEATNRAVGLQAILPTPVMSELVLEPPRAHHELAAIRRVGTARASRYGETILGIVN